MDMSESQAGAGAASKKKINRTTILKQLALVWGVLFISNLALYIIFNSDGKINLSNFSISDSSKKYLSEDIFFLLYSNDDLYFESILGSILRNFNINKYDLIDERFIATPLDQHQKREAIEFIIRRDIISPMRDCVKSHDNRNIIRTGVIPECMARLSLGAQYATPEGLVGPHFSIDSIIKDLDKLHAKLDRIIESEVSQDISPDFMFDIFKIKDTLLLNSSIIKELCKNPKYPEYELIYIEKCTDNKDITDISVEKLSSIIRYFDSNIYVLTEVNYTWNIIIILITSFICAASIIMLRYTVNLTFFDIF
jgi:hypothetical protein